MAPESKGVPDRESRTGTRLVSPAVSHEKKKWNPLSHVTSVRIWSFEQGAIIYMIYHFYFNY